MSNEQSYEKVHILDTLFFKYILGTDFTLREIKDERSMNDWNNKEHTDMS